MGHFGALQPPFFYFIDLLFSNKTFYLCVHTFLEDFNFGGQPSEPTGSGKKIGEPHPSSPHPPVRACLGPGSRRNDSRSVRPLGLSKDASAHCYAPCTAHSCAPHTVGSCISSFVFQCLPHGEPTVAVPVVWAPNGIFCMWLNQRKSPCPELSRMTFASDTELVQLSSNSF